MYSHIEVTLKNKQIKKLAVGPFLTGGAGDALLEDDLVKSALEAKLGKGLVESFKAVTTEVAEAQEAQSIETVELAIAEYESTPEAAAAKAWAVHKRTELMEERKAFIDNFLSSQPEKPTGSDGNLVVDNFQDGNGNAPFDLQLRTTAKETNTYIAILREVPYDEVPDLKADYGLEYDLEVTKGETGYNFTFTVELEANGKIRLRGGVPSPAGESVKPELYIK